MYYYNISSVEPMGFIVNLVANSKVSKIKWYKHDPRLNTKNTKQEKLFEKKKHK